MGYTKPERPDLSFLPVRVQWVWAPRYKALREMSVTSATELREEVKLEISFGKEELGESGSEPGLVIYSLEESGSEMDECVEMLVVETARRASRIITSGDERGTLLARRGCRQWEEVPKSERES